MTKKGIKKQVKIGYMDKIDFEEELGKAHNGNKIFPSPSALIEHMKCVTECGIVEVEITLKKVIKDTKYTPPKGQT